MNQPAFAFPDSPARYAGIEDIKRTFHASPMSVYYERYLRGGHGTKSTDREKIVLATAEVRNCSGRVLSFLVALCRQGFDGMLCPLDVISERMKRSTGGKGEPRTIRRCLITLEQLGYIHRAYHRTGSQVMTPKGLLNLQVLKITFTPLMLQVLGFQSVTLHRPKRPLHPKSELRINPTIGRSGLSDSVTILETKKEGVLADGVELAPACAVAQTSIQLLQSAANEKQNEQKASQVYKLEKTEETKRLGTLPEFLHSFFVAVENQCFAKKYYRETGPVSVICSILTMAQNQNDSAYPEHFPKVNFDLMSWALAPWPEQNKIIAEYVERLKIFGESPDTVSKTKACFQGVDLMHSFAVSVACLAVVGKIKFSEIDPKVKQNFFFLKNKNE